MILVNQQIKENKEYTHREAFPRLYHQDFSGKWILARHISIEIIDGNIDVQTDLSNEEVVSKRITEWIEYQKYIAEQKLQEVQNTLKILNDVISK